MALLYDAVLRPSKSEIIAGWVPTQSWFAGDAAAEVEHVASFRFDDPEGEVGVETHLVRFGTGPLLQVPLTYRGAPLAGGDDWLVGTMSHSVLGDRWIYDATGDPVYLGATATAALTGGKQADQFVQGDGELIPVAPTASAVGSGTPGAPVAAPSSSISTVSKAGTTIVTAGSLHITVVRVLDGTAVTPAADAATLRGAWPGQSTPQLLVVVSAVRTTEEPG
ncbi:hypothetical protein [Cryobacterium sp. PH29-G1]|uniref:CG0192-related protein n=1 Tax=Cryobacterium sp. PH29-G1 TaxID=3046211 RepID=UPI0024BA9FA0|nr:hypothetical protein [Cryobacterium sp. PH29-G1]MDJ0348170.1 hypothetical protein [Cryobacterium sp. PH29-G1]